MAVGTAKGGRVLVVDDDPMVRDTLGQMLADEGYVVDAATDGSDALLRVRAARPDAILLDLMMPGMNGRQFLDELRASIDPILARVDEATAQAQLASVLEHIGNFITTGDLGLHRAYLHTFLAMRAAESQEPGAVLAMLGAIGDIAVRVAQETAAGSADGAELTLMLARVTASTARALNELIAEELERRLVQRRELEAGEPGAW